MCFVHLLCTGFRLHGLSQATFSLKGGGTSRISSSVLLLKATGFLLDSLGDLLEVLVLARVNAELHLVDVPKNGLFAALACLFDRHWPAVSMKPSLSTMMLALWQWRSW